MIVAEPPPDESARLDALYSLRLLDTAPERRFDDLSLMAAEIFQVPMAFVSLIDRDRQWLKAKVGVSLCESAREISFCSHAILQDGPLVIEDAKYDLRFADNPLVTGEPYLRFYAGCPLKVSGQKVGTLCIADQKPRELSESQLATFRRLGSMAERELEAALLLDDQAKLLRVQKDLLETQQLLQEEHAEAALYVQSLLPAPLAEPLRIDWQYLPSQQLGGDCLGYHFVEPGQLAVYLFDVCGHGVGAALLSVAILSVLRSNALAEVDFTDPAAVLAGLNRAFPMERHGNKFFTMWHGVFDTARQRLRYATAGHPAALLVRQAGGVERLATAGLPIGCFSSVQYANEEVSFAPGDLLYVFSDGLFELRGEKRSLVALDEVLAILQAAAQARTPLAEVLAQVEGLEEDVSFDDDVTILQVRRSV